MKKSRPTYQQLENRLAKAEPIVSALKHHEVDAVVGDEKIAFLLLRKVEEAWLESHGELSAMFDLNGIGMVQADSPSFQFSRVNPKFCETMGYEASELLGKTYIGLTHPQDRDRDLKAFSRVIRGKTDTWSIEKRCVRKDRVAIWVMVHGFALRNRAGQVIRIMAMVEDITERKQAEQRQREALEPLKKQLKERAAEMAQLVTSLRGQVARRDMADKVLRAIHEFVERAIRPVVGTSPAVGSKPAVRKKVSKKSPRKSAGRKPAGKPRSR
ncbi:MAG: PAS domain S-box protein [Planctomycetes bacterium]|nr:PAS domain S-box protein [Planctomycetota bacterium]